MRAFNDPEQIKFLKFAAHVILDSTYVIVSVATGFILGQVHSSGHDVTGAIVIITIVIVLVSAIMNWERY